MNQEVEESIKLLSDCLFSHQEIDYDKSTERFDVYGRSLDHYILDQFVMTMFGG